MACFLYKTIGYSIISSVCKELPVLPSNAPDRIRSVEEVAKLSWKPYLFVWRTLFFCYRVFLKPNITDIVVFVIFSIVVGLVFCVLDGVLILGAILVVFLILPPIVTRSFVSSFLMARLGSPIINTEQIN